MCTVLLHSSSAWLWLLQRQCKSLHTWEPAPRRSPPLPSSDFVRNPNIPFGKASRSCCHLCYQVKSALKFWNTGVKVAFIPHFLCEQCNTVTQTYLHIPVTIFFSFEVVINTEPRSLLKCLILSGSVVGRIFSFSQQATCAPRLCKPGTESRNINFLIGFS